jgi:uncharacterized alpha/beta hydrolase family protein
MKDPKKKVKDFSVSQYPRSGNFQEMNRLGYAEGNFMGYSIRNERYRYTIWMKDNFRSTQPFRNELLVACELYDYQVDPDETINVVDKEEYASISKEMHEQMLRFLKTQEKTKTIK